MICYIEVTFKAGLTALESPQIIKSTWPFDGRKCSVRKDRSSTHQMQVENSSVEYVSIHTLRYSE